MRSKRLLAVISLFRRMPRFIIRARMFMFVFIIGDSSFSQRTDPNTVYSFTWNIPAYNHSGSFTMSGGMMPSGPGQKLHGYFKFMDDKGDLLGMITPQSLDSLKMKLQAKMTTAKPMPGRKDQIHKLQAGLMGTIDKLKGILEDESRMKAILTQMNSKKGNGPQTLWNWSHVISTVRSIQETVNGTVDW